MNEQINIVTEPTADQLKSFFNLLVELRPQLTWSVFQDIYDQAAKSDSYKLVGLMSKGEIVAVMGYRILYDFLHGKHIYIDDLVTASAHRSKGFGAVLLAFAEQQAAEHQCFNLRLCTGNDNHSGQKFYLKNGWSQRALVYKKKMASQN